MKNINKILEGIFSDLNPKQKKILNERFGLKGGKRTLQAVGDDLNVTRERVRQIENQTVKTIKPRIEREFAALIKTAEKTLAKKRGVCRDDKFISNIRTAGKLDDAEYLDNKIRFVFLVAGMPYFYREDDEVYSFWYKDKKAEKELFSYLKKVIEFFRKNKEGVLEKKVYKRKFSEPIFENFVSISKRFKKNVFGDFGLREWSEIEPKVIRDKAHLILKKKNKPFHFSDIAKEIEQTNIDNKNVHVQTVHNELIKDSRFILVGRGIYGLRSQGYEGGTVKEVIEKILKEEGPLSAGQVVKLVNRKKILKKNTILLNLQNGSHFESGDDGKYRIRKA